jgi:predicted branched-subunit amino acid permease
MDLSDLQFWAFLAVAIPTLFLPVVITGWKGRPIVPIVLLSLAFWPGALILALRLRRQHNR